MYLAKAFLIFLVGFNQAYYTAAVEGIESSLNRITSKCPIEDPLINYLIKSLVNQQVEINECLETIKLCYLSDFDYGNKSLVESLENSVDECDQKSIYDTLVKLLAIGKQDLNRCHEKAKECVFYPPERIDENNYYLSMYPAEGVDNAMKYCRGIGGYLAEFDSFAEMRKAQEYIKSLRSFVVIIAGSDAAKEGYWIFPRTGKAMNVFDWSQGEPNNVGGNENCIVLWTFKEGKMNDIRCNYSGTSYKFLCEVP